MVTGGSNKLHGITWGEWLQVGILNYKASRGGMVTGGNNKLHGITWGE